MRHVEQLEVAGAYETPIEQYAREGKILTGCLYGAHKQTTGKGKSKRDVLDANRNPIWIGNCGMLCDAGKKYCPRHIAMTAHKEASKA
jgi:hypothetical protein